MSNGEPQCFKVLYTKHLLKKRKTYHDGYLFKKSKRVAALIDEVRLAQHFDQASLISSVLSVSQLMYSGK